MNVSYTRDFLIYVLLILGQVQYLLSLDDPRSWLVFEQIQLILDCGDRSFMQITHEGMVLTVAVILLGSGKNIR